MRHNYWSCGSFASWLRRTFGNWPDKPEFAEAKEWSDWNKSGKANSPFVYWITEEFLDSLQDFIYWPYDKLTDARNYIVNRWIDKSHYIKTGFKPGSYCNIGDKMLYGLFNELVDYVEIELAWLHCVCDKVATKKYHCPKHRWTWRSAKAGLEYLDWESNLRWDVGDGVDKDDPYYGQLTSQAINAREVLRLYNWWKTIRPDRPDPYDASGWNELCNRNRGDNFWDMLGDNKSPELQAESDVKLKVLKNMEEQQNTNDEEMLIDLIKLRRNLWT
jgi:hypothetical protein